MLQRSLGARAGFWVEEEGEIPNGFCKEKGSWMLRVLIWSLWGENQFSLVKLLVTLSPKVVKDTICHTGLELWLGLAGTPQGPSYHPSFCHKRAESILLLKTSLQGRTSRAWGRMLSLENHHCQSSWHGNVCWQRKAVLGVSLDVGNEVLLLLRWRNAVEDFTQAAVIKSY